MSEMNGNLEECGNVFEKEGALTEARSAASHPDAAHTVASLWKSVLGLPRVGLDDQFFESGGTSLLATVLMTRINQSLGLNLAVETIFEHPTLRAMNRLIEGGANSAVRDEAPTPLSSKAEQIPLAANPSTNAIAIIGVTGRFPGAESVEAFWKNLCEGVESITAFHLEELDEPERALAKAEPSYVAARPVLKDADKFDSSFFGVYPKEADQMDPQHRVFLECAWEVLERAGYDPGHTTEPVGVFAGCSMNTYFMRNLVGGREFLEEFTGAYQVGNYVTMLGNDKDFLPTRVS